MPVEEFSFDAEKGDTLFPKSGSIILFPADALVDANGALIKGKVDVRYREFSDPVDFFVAGIPMDYEMNGEKYVFESSGMMELTVTSQNKAVFVNPANKPEVNLATKNTDPEHNVYYLDTVQKKWVEKGKDVIIETTRSFGKNTPEKRTMPVFDIEKPEKPVEASVTQPVFEVQIDPSAMPELKTYNNIKFEIDKSDKTFNAKDGEVEWEDVKVEKTNTKGLYKVTFSKTNRKVSYMTRPVLESKDYNAALKQFEIKNKQYEQALAARSMKEKIENEKAAVIDKQGKELSKENEKIKRMNLLIEARNKEIEARNAITLEKNKETIKNNSEIAENNKRREAEAKKAEEENQRLMDEINKEVATVERIRTLIRLIKAEDPKASSYSVADRELAARFIKEEQEAELRQAEMMRRYKRIKELIDLIKNNDPKVNSYDQGEKEEAFRAVQNEKDEEKQQLVFRSFEVSGFGLYNCDRPFKSGEQAITATFVDNKGGIINLKQVSVVYQGFNGVTTSDPNNLRVKAEASTLLFAINNGKLVYLTYDDFSKYKLLPSDREKTFDMRIYPTEINSPEEIRKILGI